MKRPEKIDLFDLSDKVLEKLNCNGKFHLTHYDFSLKFRREIHFPSDKFNIDLVLFGEEITVSYYTIDYFSVDKIVSLFFVHLSDDYGYDQIEDAVIATKRANLTNKLKETISEIEALLKLHGFENSSAFVDEKYPYDKVDEKGLPFFELNVVSLNQEIDFKIDLSWLSCDSSDRKRFVEITNKNLQNN